MHTADYYAKINGVVKAAEDSAAGDAAAARDAILNALKGLGKLFEK